MMKKILPAILILVAMIVVSCGSKKEEPVKQTPKQEVEKIDTVQKAVEPAAVEVVPEPRGPKTIVVQKGEWLYDIARKEYNDIHAWRKIYDANKDKIQNPDLIYPSQVLILPE